MTRQVKKPEHMSSAAPAMEIIDLREEATAVLEGAILRLACPGGIGHVVFRLQSPMHLTVKIAIPNCEGLDVTMGDVAKERHDFDLRQEAETATFELDAPADQDIRIQWIDYYR